MYDAICTANGTVKFNIVNTMLVTTISEYALTQNSMHLQNVGVYNSHKILTI